MWIYEVTNLVNGKKYIGMTEKTVENRWRTHLKNARAGRRSKLYSAIRKYGETSFQIEGVEKAIDKIDLCNRERNRIASYDPNILYNMTEGGEGGGDGNVLRQYSFARRGKSNIELYGEKRAREISIKQSKSLLGKCKEKIISVESREKSSKSLRDRYQNDDVFREKMIERNRAQAKSGECHHMYGKKHSALAKEKISKSSSRSWEERQGKINSDLRKKNISESYRGERNPFYSNISRLEILKYFEEQPNLTIEQLAIMIGVSRPTLGKRLREWIGCDNFQIWKKAKGDDFLVSLRLLLTMDL